MQQSNRRIVIVIASQRSHHRHRRYIPLINTGMAMTATTANTTINWYLF